MNVLYGEPFTTIKNETTKLSIKNKQEGRGN